MSSILIDNWTLQRAAASIRDTYDRNLPPNREYVKLAEAIVLWDQIYYVNNEYSAYWQNILREFGYSEFLLPASDLCETDEEYSICTGHAKFLSLFHSSIIAQGAIEYQAIADQLCVGYLPSQERAEYLSKEHGLVRVPSRQDIMEYFDRSIVEYYEELNARLRIDEIKYDFPVLFDYIFDNSSSAYFIDQAVHLKNNSEVKRFRDTMSSLEYEVSSGNYKVLQSCLDDIEKIIESMKKTFRIQMKGELQLSINPSLIPSVITKLSALYDISLPKRIHMSFLRTLADYAITNRRLQ